MTEPNPQPVPELSAATFPHLVADLEEFAKTLFTEFEPTNGLLAFGLWWTDDEYAHRYPTFNENGQLVPGEKHQPVQRPPQPQANSATAVFNLYKVQEERYRAYSAAVAKYHGYLDAKLPRHVKVDLCHHYGITFTAYASLSWSQKVTFLKAEYNTFRADDVRQITALIPKVIPSTQTFAALSAEMSERFDQLHQAGATVSPIEQMIRLEDACAGLQTAMQAITLYKDSTEATAQHRSFGAMRKAILNHIKNAPSTTAKEAGFVAHATATAQSTISAQETEPVTLQALASNVTQLAQAMRLLVERDTAHAYNTRKRPASALSRDKMHNERQTDFHYCAMHGPGKHSTAECTVLAAMPLEARNHYLSLPILPVTIQEAIISARQDKSDSYPGHRRNGLKLSGRHRRQRSGRPADQSA